MTVVGVIKSIMKQLSVETRSRVFGKTKIIVGIADNESFPYLNNVCHDL